MLEPPASRQWIWARRDVVVPMAVLMCGSVLLLALTFLATAKHVDTMAAERAEAIARGALTASQDQLGRVARDHGNAGPTYAALHLRLDIDWQDKALQASLAQSHHIDLLCTFDGRGRPLITLNLRQPAVRTDCAAIARLEPLLDAARANARPRAAGPVTGIVRVQETLATAAAIAVTPGAAEEIVELPGPPTLLVLVRLLDTGGLQRLPNQQLFESLATDAAVATGPGRLPLAALDGTPLGSLVWHQPRPGTELVQRLLPVAAVALFAMAAAAFLVLSRSQQRALRALGASASALQLSEARFRDFAEAASDWLWETDVAGRFTYLSDRHMAVVGVPNAQRLGRTRWELGLPEIDNDPGKWAGLRRDLDLQRDIKDFHYRLVSTDGRPKHVKINGRPVYDATGAFTGYRGTGSDITAEVEARERAHQLAYHDALTGLPNRLSFAETLALHLAALPSGAGGLAVLLLDLDRFKEVNDTLGHHAGDRLLCLAAERLRAALRPGDVLARVSGDEFAILVGEVRSASQLEPVCCRLIEAVEQPFEIAGELAHVGLSIGAALAPEQGTAAETLTRRADLALYRAKADGRGMWRLFEAAMEEARRERLTIENELREALSRGELDVHYQPQFDLDGDRVVGIEALLRWRHPRLGDVPPDRFIPLAEQNGLIVQLGLFVLDRACHAAVAWPDLRVSVNLSPVQFRHRGLVGQVAAILATSGLPASRLELELTENVLLPNSENALAILNALKRLGVGIVMDDFGSGYSSLRYLQQFPFDRIKIDRSFIHGLLHDPDAAAIVRAVIGLGRSLGLDITAEGVETESQLGFLRDEGCPTVQGFLVGRPAPMVDIERLLGRLGAVPAAGSRRPRGGLAEAPLGYRPPATQGLGMAGARPGWPDGLELELALLVGPGMPPGQPPGLAAG